ncbi:MAG: LysR family transcriptional regulator [Salinibacterium sp.]|nr:MAG: LysR family transcriptional regulator [Salinibacterium sp.]
MTVPLELRPLSPADAQSALRDGSADVALVRLPLALGGDGFSAIPLYEETAVVVAPKEHELDALDSVVLADLEGFTVLHGEWSDSIELVAANVGVAVMPLSVARALSRRDVISRPLTDAPSTTIALVWPTERTTPLVEEFIGIVRGRTANSSRGAAAALNARGENGARRAAHKATPKQRGSGRSASRRPRRP